MVRTSAKAYRALKVLCVLGTTVLGTTVLGTTLVSCGGPVAPTAQTNKALVTLQCDVPDAEVWVDGRYFREVAELNKAFRLSAGDHRIEVRHPRYHSMYYELTVADGTRQDLRVDLAQRLP